MIISKTPFRMSFFGGGTDFSEFYEKEEGKVIATTFNKYCYVILRKLPPFFDYKNEVVYSKIERTRDVNDIMHPLVRNVLKYLDIKNIHISYDADLPARTGLATSSAFAVGLLNSAYLLKGIKQNKKKLADDAIYVERVLCSESGGIQDQIEVAFGGLNLISFKKDGWSVSNIEMNEKRKQILNDNLMLFYTGISRNSYEIQNETKKKINDKNQELKEMLKILEKALEVLTNDNKNIDEFGTLLNDTWKLKRSIANNISNEFIDKLYNKALDNGAIGGKLLGAGGGGFLLLYVPKENQSNVKKILSDELYIPFKFENEGTKVLYNYEENII